MTANIAQQTATPTNSPDATQPVPAASSGTMTESQPAPASCQSTASLMLCEVRSYRRGMYDDGLVRLIYVPERCSVCPWRCE